VAIINDYEAIARRLRELNPVARKDADIEKWRDLAAEIAQTHVDSRRRGPLADVPRNRGQRIIPRHGR
jgi:hypothetical protein